MDRNGQHEIEFPATLILEGRPELHCVARLSYVQHDPTYLEVSLVWVDATNQQEMAWLPGSLDPNKVTITSRSAAHPTVIVLGIQDINSSYGRLSFSASAIEIGLSEQAANGLEAVPFVAQIQPSGILALPTSFTRYQTGRIDVDTRNTGKITVNTPVAQVDIAATFDYAEDRQFGDVITKQVHRATLQGKLRLGANTGLESQHQRLLDEIQRVCTILSLCYRQQVGVYEVAYLFRDPNTQAFSRSVYRRKWRRAKARRPGQELVHALHLVDGGLERLCQSLAKHEEQARITRAIDFLSGSYGANLETAFFMTFSALETLVDVATGPSTRMNVSSAKWRKVEKSLKATLQQMEESNELTPEQAASLREKLPELKRTSFVTRSISAIDRLGVKTSDIWERSLLPNGLSRASTLRNGLFHDADNDSGHELVSGLYRLRILAERIALACLEWPPEHIWPHHAEVLAQLD